MITVQVPQFDEFQKYKFTGYKKVQIKNKPDWTDVNKITALLPGIPQGGCGRFPLQDLLKDKFKSVESFYDIRQRTKWFKGYHVTIVEKNNLK